MNRCPHCRFTWNAGDSGSRCQKAVEIFRPDRRTPVSSKATGTGPVRYRPSQSRSTGSNNSSSFHSLRENNL